MYSTESWGAFLWDDPVDHDQWSKITQIIDCTLSRCISLLITFFVIGTVFPCKFKDQRNRQCNYFTIMKELGKMCSWKKKNIPSLKKSLSTGSSMTPVGRPFKWQSNHLRHSFRWSIRGPGEESVGHEWDHGPINARMGHLRFCTIVNTASLKKSENPPIRNTGHVMEV